MSENGMRSDSDQVAGLMRVASMLARSTGWAVVREVGDVPNLAVLPDRRVQIVYAAEGYDVWSMPAFGDMRLAATNVSADVAAKWLES